jgi:putative flippase GtrA
MNFCGRVIRYGVVGIAISALYSLSVVLLVDQIHMANATAASVLAFAAVLPLAYAAHRRVTFSDAAHDPLAPLRFAASTAASFLVATGGMYAVTEIFAHSYLLGIALNWVLIPIMNFLIYLVWVFRVGPIRPGGALPAGTGSPPARARGAGDER